MKTFIYVISIEFLSLRRRRLSYETPLPARSKETRLYSQARRDLIKGGIFFSNGWSGGPILTRMEMALR